MPQTDTNIGVEVPRQLSFQDNVAAVVLGSDLNTDLFRCPYDGAVDTVTYVTPTVYTGAATNYRSWSLVNLGAAGVGNTVIATLAGVGGVNTVAHVEKTITLSGTPANLQVAAGDILQWQSLHLGTGLADPGGLVIIAIGRT